MKNYWKADLEFLNIFEIDYAALKNEKIENLMFDLDDTIFPSGNYFLNYKILNFFIALQKNFNVIIVTSAGFYTPPILLKIFKKLYLKHIMESQRIGENFRNQLTTFLGIKTIIFNVNKTNIIAYKKIMIQQGFKNSQTAMIGNSLEDDIFIPNILGIKTILVKKIPEVEKVM